MNKDKMEVCVKIQKIPKIQKFFKMKRNAKRWKWVPIANLMFCVIVSLSLAACHERPQVIIDINDAEKLRQIFESEKVAREKWGRADTPTPNMSTRAED